MFHFVPCWAARSARPGRRDGTAQHKNALALRAASPAFKQVRFQAAMATTIWLVVFFFYFTHGKARPEATPVLRGEGE
ncbi:MAG: hypothetical protein ABI897_01040 [Spartobacteria bacterium]